MALIAVVAAIWYAADSRATPRPAQITSIKTPGFKLPDVASFFRETTGSQTPAQE
jgi:hypothetical protein